MKQLIDKSAVMAEIERRRKEIPKDETNKTLKTVYGNEAFVLTELLSFLDTLEVKEVDLNEEYIEEIYSHIDGIRDTADRMTSGNFMHHRAAIKFSANVIEQVLGLIGFKSQKGE